MADTKTLIEQAYSAFNKRDIDGALALMTQDVSWPKASEGGKVVGKEEIRAYWNRQWGEFDPHVEPIAMTEEDGGKTRVRVHQLVKSLQGDVLSDSEVIHVFTTDQGRIMYVGSSSTAFPLPGYGLYSGSKMAPRFFLEVLAKELGPRGVTVNSILPTVTAGAGLSTDAVRPQASEFIRTFNPMQRVGTLGDVADAAEYFASDLSALVSGQHLLLSGGGPA
jgi:NAD(P)-dependent dehydrogenase (short-subunit alcohol dehydrogenase family)